MNYIKQLQQENKELKEEIKSKELEISNFGPIQRSYASVDSFLDSKDKTSSLDDFNYKVLQGQIKQTGQELSQLSAKKKELEKEHLD